MAMSSNLLPSALAQHATLVGTAAAPPVPPPTTTAPEWVLILAALVGIATIVVLITWVKLHPFLALVIGAIVTGLVAGMSATQTITSFSNGFGSTAGGVGVLIALGAIYGKLLADSGGADRIVDTLVSRASAAALPWVMGLVGALIGLPMFFEVGLVLLVPVIILVARRSGVSLMKIAIPTLAGLSAMHGLVPAAPRSARRDRPDRRQPRRHPRVRRARRDPDRHHRGPAVRPSGRALGERAGAGAVPDRGGHRAAR